MPRVYCVEDDENIRDLTIYALTSSGFEATGYDCAAAFFDKIKEELCDLVLLDIMLPDIDGMEILKMLRAAKRTKNIPVILLTANSTEIDKVKGLDMGADDYITKPFGVMELISRIKAVLRRVNKEGEKIAFEGIVMDRQSRKVTSDGREVTLTYKEFELLYYLLKNKGIVLGRDMLMNEVWGFDFEGESRTVDVHIRTLRQKLGESGAVIQTVRNVGYKVGV